MDGGLVTFVGVTHPWMCDAMGHMNMRFYAAMIDDAGFQLLGHLAGTEAEGEPGLAGAPSAPRSPINGR